MSDHGTRPSGARRVATWGIAGLVVLVLALVVAVTTMRSRSVSRIERVRDRLLAEGAGASLSKPATPPNASALQLETLAHAIGVDLAPRSRPNASRPPGEPPRAVSQNAAVTSLLRERKPPDEEVADWMAHHDAEIAAIVDHLVTQEPPRWEEGSATLDAPLPNLLGILRLLRILTIRALVTADVEAARDSFMAATALAMPLLERDETISVTIGVHAVRLLAEAAPELPVDEASWTRTLGAAGLAGPVLRSIDTELAATCAFILDPALVSHEARLSTKGPWHAALRRTAVPMLGADSLEREIALRDVIRSAAPCHAIEPPSATHMPPWAHSLAFEHGGFADEMLHRARLGELELELTRRILAARDLRDRGALPPGADVTAMLGAPRVTCPGLRWIEEVLPDGRLRFEIAGDVPWDVQAATPPRPLAWTERTPSATPP